MGAQCIARLLGAVCGHCHACSSQFSRRATLLRVLNFINIINQTMRSQQKIHGATYKGNKDLESLLRTDEWSPTSLFPQIPRKPQPCGPYLKNIEFLSKNGRPDLRYLWKEFERQNWGSHAERSRVVVIEYSAGGDLSVPNRQETFSKSQSLREYLGGASKHSCNRIYIIEDISRDYVEVIGAEFS